VELARAYAVLGMSPGSSAWQVQREYRRQARQWHPDRWSGDPALQAVAAERMRDLNDAIREIRAAALERPRSRPAPVRSPPASPVANAPLWEDTWPDKLLRMAFGALAGLFFGLFQLPPRWIAAGVVAGALLALFMKDSGLRTLVDDGLWWWWD